MPTANQPTRGTGTCWLPTCYGSQCSAIMLLLFTLSAFVCISTGREQSTVVSPPYLWRYIPTAARDRHWGVTESRLQEHSQEADNIRKQTARMLAEADSENANRKQAKGQKERSHESNGVGI